MSQTVQKSANTEQPANTGEETENLELENNLDKSWSGLYSRWKKQLEKDFREDPSQKWKLWLHGSVCSSIPIIYNLISSVTLPLAILTLLWWVVFYKQDLSDMVGNTSVGIMYSFGLLIDPMPFIGAALTIYLINKIF